VKRVERSDDDDFFLSFFLSFFLRYVYSRQTTPPPRDERAETFTTAE